MCDLFIYIFFLYFVVVNNKCYQKNILQIGRNIYDVIYFIRELEVDFPCAEILYV